MKNFFFGVLFVLGAITGAAQAQDDGLEDEFTLIYLTYINKDGVEGPVKCRQKEYALKIYVLCEFNNGLSGGHKGLWQVDQSSGTRIIYAVNGKAKTAMSVLPNYSDVQVHPDPLSVDIQNVLNKFRQ